MRIGAVIIAASVLGAGRACHASTPEAWEEFDSRVLAASESLVDSTLLDAEICVDPFGSESYGIAIIHGFDRSTSAEVVFITVYDKATDSIEISGEFTPSEMEWWRELVEENLRLRRALESIKNERRTAASAPSTIPGGISLGSVSAD